MRVYISGPITGMPNYNREAFAKASADLRAMGHDPVNPLDIAERIGFDHIYSEFMREDIRALLDCEALYLLPGWEASRGACMEVRLAEILDIKVVHR